MGNSIYLWPMRTADGERSDLAGTEEKEGEGWKGGLRSAASVAFDRSSGREGGREGQLTFNNTRCLKSYTSGKAWYCFQRA